MKTKITLILVLAAIMVLGAGSVWAQTSPNPTFMKLDTDEDGATDISIKWEVMTTPAAHSGDDAIHVTTTATTRDYAMVGIPTSFTLTSSTEISYWGYTVSGSGVMAPDEIWLEFENGDVICNTGPQGTVGQWDEWTLSGSSYWYTFDPLTPVDIDAYYGQTVVKVFLGAGSPTNPTGVDVDVYLDNLTIDETGDGPLEYTLDDDTGTIEVLCGTFCGITGSTGIQVGIDAALSGDTINVAEGTYTEKILVDGAPYPDHLTIKASGSAENTIISWTGMLLSTRGVFTTNSMYTELRGFTIQGVRDMVATTYVVRVVGAFCTIADNIVKNSNTIAGVGIEVASTGGCNITNNTVTDNVYGIELVSAQQNNLTGNNVSGNDLCGIRLEESNDNTITGNTIANTDGQGIAIMKLGEFGDPSTGNKINYNNIYGSTNKGVYKNHTPSVDAEYNWWGDASGPDGEGPGSGDSVSTNVDYSPWWGDNYVGDPHTTAWTWYTNDSIQDAIDVASAGDVVNVAAGTYDESVLIGKNLTVDGAGTGSIINPPGDVDYLVKANGDYVVNFKDFMIDGSGNLVKYGIFYNAGATGEISGCTVQNIEWDAGNAQGIRCIDSDPDIKSNTIQSFGRDGIYVRGSGIGLSMLIDDNDVIGQGHSVPADHMNKGIMIYDGASPTVQNNELYNLRTHTIWGNPAIEISNYPDGNAANPLIQDNNIHDCDLGLSAGYEVGDLSSPIVRHNTFTDIGKGATPSGVQALIVLYGNATIGGNTAADGNTFIFNSDTDKANVAIMLGINAGSGATVKNNTVTGNDKLSHSGLDILADGVTVSHNTVTGAHSGIALELHSNGATLSDNDLSDCIWSGIEVRGTNVTVTNNDIYDNPRGIELYEDGTGVFNYNNIHGNTYTGINNTTGNSVDATYNWWGDASGPSGEGPGTGDAVSANVDYSPWWGANYVGDDHTSPWTWYTDDSIQDAIDVATGGDTINVYDGTYNENVVINESLTVQAASDPIIDGGDALENPAIHITAANVTVDGFIIENFIATGGGQPSDVGAILVEGDNAKILNNIVRSITCTGTAGDCPAGLGIDVHANEVDLISNKVYDISSIGIRVRHDWTTLPTTSNNILIDDNEVHHTGNSCVLITGYAQGVTITNNDIYESLVSGTAYNLFVHYGASDITIGGVGVGNHIYDAYANIVLAGCDNVTIEDNVIEDAIPLSPTVKGKNIYILNDYNSWTGTKNLLSTNVDILGNDILNAADGWGVRIRNIDAADPSDMAATTEIHLNNIVGNTGFGVENMILTDDVDAEYNYWGALDGPSGEGSGTGDAVSANVDYDPWLGYETNEYNIVMEGIIEPQNQYYNTAPTFANFGFYAELGLNTIDFSTDGTNWTNIASSITGQSWSDDGWTLPNFASLSDGAYTVSFRAYDDDGHLGGGAGVWDWSFYKQTVNIQAVAITDFSDPIDDGGHLNVEFEQAKGVAHYRLYYAEGYTTWPGNENATMVDPVDSPYDLVTTDETNYMVRVYWIDEAGNQSSNYAEAGPMQSINNSTVYVGTFDTYEFGTATYPYDTIGEGITNVSDGGTVYVAARTYNERITINKALTLNGANVGVAGNSISRGAESIIDADDDGAHDYNAITITSGSVTIDGFKIIDADDPILALFTANMTDIVVKNNKIDGSECEVDGGTEGIAFISLGGSGSYQSYSADGAIVQDNYIYSNDKNAITFQGVSGLLTITGNTIDDCKNGICIDAMDDEGDLPAGDGLINVTGTTVTDNSVTHLNSAWSWCVLLNGLQGSLTLTDNILQSYQTSPSYGIAIQLSHPLGNRKCTGMVAHYNDFEHNGAGIYNNHSEVDAEVDGVNNWWGDNSGPTHSGNPGGTGSDVTDNVVYEPWIGKPEGTFIPANNAIVTNPIVDFNWPDVAGTTVTYDIEVFDMVGNVVKSDNNLVNSEVQYTFSSTNASYQWHTRAHVTKDDPTWGDMHTFLLNGNISTTWHDEWTPPPKGKSKDPKDPIEIELTHGDVTVTFNFTEGNPGVLVADGFNFGAKNSIPDYFDIICDLPDGEFDVDITMPFDDTRFTGHSLLGMYYQSGSDWIALETGTLTATTLTANTDHFTNFSVIDSSTAFAYNVPYPHSPDSYMHSDEICGLLRLVVTNKAGLTDTITQIEVQAYSEYFEDYVAVGLYNDENDDGVFEPYGADSDGQIASQSLLSVIGENTEITTFSGLNVPIADNASKTIFVAYQLSHAPQRLHTLTDVQITVEGITMTHSGTNPSNDDLNPAVLKTVDNYPPVLGNPTPGDGANVWMSALANRNFGIEATNIIYSTEYERVDTTTTSTDHKMYIYNPATSMYYRPDSADWDTLRSASLIPLTTFTDNKASVSLDLSQIGADPIYGVSDGNVLYYRFYPIFDISKNQNNSISYTFTMDMLAPTISNIRHTGVDSFYTAGETVTIKFDVVDTQSGVDTLVASNPTVTMSEETAGDASFVSYASGTYTYDYVIPASGKGIKGGGVTVRITGLQDFVDNETTTDNVAINLFYIERTAPVMSAITFDNTNASNYNDAFIKDGDTFTFTSTVTADYPSTDPNDYHAMLDKFDLGADVTADSVVSKTAYWNRTIVECTPANAQDSNFVRVWCFDLAGNESLEQNDIDGVTGGLTSDNTPPTVETVTATPDTITDADEGGKAGFTLAIEFNDDMNQNVNPTISFDPDVSGSLTFASGSSDWTSSTTYTAIYTVTDTDTTINDIDVIVSGAKDKTGNLQSPQTIANVFDIDTKNPTCTVDAQVDPIIDGSLTQTIEVTYSELMNAGVDPTITITGLASPYNVTGGIWTHNGYSVYTATVPITDEDEENTATVNVSLGKDVAGNTQVANISETFEVDTKNPTCTVVATVDPISDCSLTQTIIVTYNEAMNPDIDPTITINGLTTDPYNVIEGDWTHTDSVYTATVLITDDDEENTATVNVSGAKDIAGNTQTPCSTTFEVDTKSPSVVSITPSDALCISDADAGEIFTVTVCYDEAMCTSTYPTITFNPLVSHTLTPYDTTWTNGDSCYVVDYTVTDADTAVCGVDIEVSGGVDATCCSSNVQDPDTLPNAFNIDTENPISSATSATYNPGTGNIDVPWTAFDASGIARVVLWARKVGVGPYAAVDTCDTPPATAGTFYYPLTPASAEGTYDFYTIATDVPGNVETDYDPAIPDAIAIVDVEATKFNITTTPPSPTVGSTFIVNVEAVNAVELRDLDYTATILFDSNCPAFVTLPNMRTISNGYGTYDDCMAMKEFSDLTITVYDLPVGALESTSDPIIVGPAVIAPPTAWAGTDTIAFDVPDDQGGWINLNYTMSINDAFHSSAEIPYIDYYVVERFSKPDTLDPTGAWQAFAFLGCYNPESDSVTALLDTPASDSLYPYRMAAVYTPGGSTIFGNNNDSEPVTIKNLKLERSKDSNSQNADSRLISHKNMQEIIEIQNIGPQIVYAKDIGNPKTGYQSDWTGCGNAAAADNLPAYANFTVFLEGPYAGSSVMNTYLTTIPTVSPYDLENIGTLPTVSGHSIVDWVHIQLRESKAGATVKSANGFLLENGSIVDVNGNYSLPYYYTTGQKYYIVIVHRNHLSIMTAVKKTFGDLESEATNINLSIAGSVYGNGFKEVEPGVGVYAMYAGDGNGSGTVNPADAISILDNYNSVLYNDGDLNLSDLTNPADAMEILGNLNKFTTVPENGKGNQPEEYVDPKVDEDCTLNIQNAHWIGSTYYFDVYITRNPSWTQNTGIGSLWGVLSSTLVLNITESAFSSPSTNNYDPCIDGTTPIILGNNRLSIELSGTGTAVPTSSSKLMTVSLTIENPSATAGLSWRTADCVIYKSDDLSYATLELLGSDDQTLPVVLSKFTAQYLNNVPTLYWVTQSETDNIGWYVYRGTEDDFTTTERVTDLLEGHGTTSEPHSYFYYDKELEAIHGEMYWYWIESVEYGGQFHSYGPVVITVPPDYDQKPVVEKPIEYGLHQNTPNPFVIGSGLTKISFALPKTAYVELKIYNIRGELVRNLYSGPAYGDKLIEEDWDGRSESDVMQAPGIYLYQLKVDGKSYKIKRLILMR